MDLHELWRCDEKSGLYILVSFFYLLIYTFTSYRHRHTFATLPNSGEIWRQKSPHFPNSGEGVAKVWRFANSWSVISWT
jgi:hypothetical protein